MDTLSIYAYAKVNLFLSVGARRPDGYHDLESIFQRISLCDEIKITKNGDDGISFSCSDPSLPCNENNLAVRAAKAFFQAHGSSFGVKIHLEKRIPSQAGLGGGSADAAAVLCALNELCGFPFSKEALARIGATLGADVPFCIYGGAMTARGIGEILSPCAPLRDLFLVVAKGDAGISTKAAYAALDARGVSECRSYRAMTDALKTCNTDAICASLFNDFETVTDVHLPLKTALLAHGAKGALMSGSGSAVFGIFTDAQNAQACASALQKEGYFAAVCTPKA
jgi:4-diphosphocytidyl-2-C-methyl-D-erythritol kinase